MENSPLEPLTAEPTPGMLTLALAIGILLFCWYTIPTTWLFTWVCGKAITGRIKNNRQILLFMVMFFNIDYNILFWNFVLILKRAFIPIFIVVHGIAIMS